MPRPIRQLALLLPLALLAVSCSTKDAKPPAAERRPVLISAAASTNEAISALTGEFARQSGVEVRINSGPSNGLASQIIAGAPADLFLSANRQWAGEVVGNDLATSWTELLTNQLVIVVPKGNPAAVHTPDDLLSDKVTKVALAGENVPAGIYADQALEKLGLLQTLTGQSKIARGQDVRATLAYVERGEAEAGIVYSSDVRVAKNVVAVYDLDPSLHEEIVYILVLLKRGADEPAANELYDFLQSGAADGVYKRFGFARLTSLSP